MSTFTMLPERSNTIMVTCPDLPWLNCQRRLLTFVGIDDVVQDLHAAALGVDVVQRECPGRYVTVPIRSSRVDHAGSQEIQPHGRRNTEKEVDNGAVLLFWGSAGNLEVSQLWILRGYKLRCRHCLGVAARARGDQAAESPDNGRIIAEAGKPQATRTFQR